MQNVVLTLLVNGLMAGLLLATIIYCLRLNARIKVLQDSRSELARIIREFDESTQRATQSISEIHAATARLSENIQHKIDKANFLADDLEYMIEKGSKIAGKPEISSARLSPAAATTAQSAQAAPAQPKTLAAAFTAEAFGAPARSAAAPKNTAFILPDEPADLPELNVAPGRVRSRAEQEIMNALSGKPTRNE